MNKDCNLKVTVKGAMTDEDGKVRMINRELTGEGVMLFVNDDVDGEHTRLHALTVGGFGITVQAKIIGALRKAWGEGRFEAALALDMIGSEKGRL